MQEEFIQFIWKHGLHHKQDLFLSSGETLTILHPGDSNPNAGPDFVNVRAMIGDMQWAGCIEIHLKSSDWYQHRHHENPAYQNVLFHVVLEHDKPVKRGDGAEIPTLLLSYPPEIEQRYLHLKTNNRPIPCSTWLQKEKPGSISFILGQLAIERLQLKYLQIKEILEQTSNNWNEAFYRNVCSALGTSINSQPFIQLARQIPYTLLQKIKDNPIRVEALLMGQSGLLDGTINRDEYHEQLSKEYQFLSKKHELKPMMGYQWKFSRLRPLNFPTIRISQLAELMVKEDKLFSRILDQPNAQQISELFEVSASTYWNTHYQFGKTSGFKEKRIGTPMIQGILINAVIPFIFAYGKEHGLPNLQEKAISLLEQLPPEQNKITRNWAEVGISARCAMETQALIHLFNHYCSPGNCLKCQIGFSILNSI
jgi:hypothetical protein